MTMSRNVAVMRILFLLLALLVSDVTAEILKKSWTVFHSLTGPGSPPSERTVRGSLSLEIDDSKSEVDDAIQWKLEDQAAISSEMSRSMTSGSTWYQLQLVPDDDKTAPPVTVTVNACSVLRARFRDEWGFMLGPTADLLSASYQPLISPLAPDSCDDFEVEPTAFDSRLTWETAQPGMTLRTILPESKPPPGLKMIPRPRVPGEPGSQQQNAFTKEQQQQQQQQEAGFFGFFKRYWYIIVPLLILNLMTAPEQPAAQQQQGQGGGAPPAAGSPARPAVAAGAAESQSSGARRRRGKRE